MQEAWLFCDRQRAVLGPALSSPITATVGISVRLRDDLRSSVAFLGRADKSNPEASFVPIGTGFFLSFEGGFYFVTAAHVAKPLAGGIFYLRLNTNTDAKCIPITSAEWIFDETDPSVDIAMTPLSLADIGSFDAGYIPGEEFFWDRKQVHENWNVGVGDMIYVVGLFKFHYGRKRNVPIVHCGNIVMLPEDERIEIEDWNADDPDARIEAEGYLIECHALDGLSGSPVFVRSSGYWQKATRDLKTKEPVNVRAAREEVLLLGLFQGSWDAKPAKLLAEQTGEDVLVPTNIGVVVPVEKIRTILRSDKAMKAKDAQKQAKKPPAATLKKSRKSPTADNPHHRSDFKRLLDAAVKPPKSSDRT